MKEETIDKLVKVAGALWLDLLIPELRFSVTIKGDTVEPDSSRRAVELARSLEAKIPYLRSAERQINGSHYEIPYLCVTPWDRIRVKRYVRENAPEARVEIGQLIPVLMGHS